MKPFPEFAVHIERERSLLRIVAHSVGARPELLMEVTCSDQYELVGLRCSEGHPTTLSRDAIAQYPALSAVLRLIVDEVTPTRPHREPLLGFLFQSLLVYARRALGPDRLRDSEHARSDARVERALALLNADVSRRWTVELLAEAVGLSRAALARQFLRERGQSPMRYLTERRMQLAAALLVGSDESLAEIAIRVGYQSEFSFNRAFKRYYQVPPGVYRHGPPTALCLVYQRAA